MADTPSRSDGRRSEGVASLIAVITGIVVGVLSFHLAGSTAASFDPSDAGLGRNTISWTSYLDGRRITARGDRPETVDELVSTYEALHEAGRPVAIWLGASQMHSINRPKPGQELASVFATRRARARSSDLAYLQVSSPNANLHDLLALFLVLQQRGVEPDIVIVAMVYDDLVERGLQRKIAEQLEPLEENAKAPLGPGGSNVESERQLALGSGSGDTPVERTILDATPQQRLEDGLVGWMEENWPAFSARGRLNAAARFLTVDTIVGMMLRINGRSKKLVSNEDRDWNLQALDSFVELKRRGDFELLVYKQPHRDDQEEFYHDRAAYDAFFASLATDAAARNYRYLDLETIVPGQYWGNSNNGQPDVFHFREEGHRILGEAVDAAIEGWDD